MPAPAVEVEVLGPLRLRVGGDVVEVPGPRRRALLGLLAMAAGRVVAVDLLLDALWPAGLPGSARATLHSHVSRLRRHLGPAAGRLAAEGAGYRLDLDGGGTDEARARALLGRASGCLSREPPDPAAARLLLDEARALWRGEPFADLADVAPLAAWAVRLGRLRRQVDEAHARATLDSGDAAGAAGLAAELAEGDPLDEAAARLQMEALARDGRAAEALRAGYAYRRRLAGETGLDPSPDFAALERRIAAASPVPPPGLARPPTPLRGRDAELAALHRLLARERLVTVLGPGGVGKSRLAAEAAARAEHATAVALAPVTDPAAVGDALAAALRLRVMHDDVLGACAALLGAGPQLLVLDGCEHVLPGARAAADRLLGACPGLTVLATSRVPLGLAGEHQLRIGPLALPAPGTDPARSPAVTLFVDRARRVRPDLELDPPGVALVAAIVARLDGIPLAVELAAGRVASLGLADLHARLDRALDLLGDAGGGSLRETIAWSYALLGEERRSLFRHLGMFPDGFDLESAERLGRELGLLSDPAAAVAGLVDASMLEASGYPAVRYRMLDTVRAFALERLAAEDDHERADGRLLAWAVDLAGRVDATIGTGEEPRTDRVLRQEMANLRAAWRLARSRGRRDEAVAIVVGLADAAGWRDLTEVWAWSLELAGDPALAGHPDAAAVLGVAATSAWSRGELERARDLAERGLAAAAGGTGGWRARAALALVALSRGDLDGAVAVGTEAAAAADRADQSLSVAALAAAYGGDLGRARALHDQSEPLATSPTLQSMRAYVEGEIEALAGRPDRAEALYRRAVELARRSGATFAEGIASVGLLTTQARAGRVGDALEGYERLVAYWERTHGWVQQWTTLRNLARLLHDLGDHDTELWLDSAAAAAPDAPAVTDPGPRCQAVAGRAAGIEAGAASAGRPGALAAATAAIARHRAELNAGGGIGAGRPRAGRAR